ncbi:MAG: Cdc6/Cdc18 family protein [Candidatus Hodarchaeota archaeon]
MSKTNFSSLFENFETVFKENEQTGGSGEDVFSVSYIPTDIRHREEEMQTLASYFQSIITSPTNSSRKVIIYGAVGTGKTLVSRSFCKDLTTFLRRNHKPGKPAFKFFYVNCRKTKSPHLILTTALRQLVPGFPLRGFSVDELLRMFTLLLYEQNLVTLLVLDEIDFLMPEDRTDFLYALSRLEESPLTRESYSYSSGDMSTESRFNLLAITRDKNFRYYLDSSTASSLGKNFIIFPKYTRSELFDIIYDRAEQGLHSECYDDALIELIAGLVEEQGDARFAIELLWRSAKLADKERKNRITPEHVRKAVVSVHPMEKSVLDDLNQHQQLLLLSTAKLLLNSSRPFVTTPEVKETYEHICEEAGVHPRRQTQIWAYLKDLGRLGLIQQDVENRHARNGRSRGRVTNISSTIPVEEIIQSLNHLVEGKS